MRAGSAGRVGLPIRVLGVLSLALLAGCGGEGGSADTSEGASSTASSSTTSSTSTTVATTELAVAVDTDEIWMTLPAGVDAAQVCSPASPAVAMVMVSGVAADMSPRGRVVDGNRRVELEFAASPDEAAWMAVVGPFEASRSSTDRVVTVHVEAIGDDAAPTATGSVELLVRAPEPCGSGTADRRDRSPISPDMELRTTPDDGVFVADGVADCAGRPTEVRVEARTKGAVVSVRATVHVAGGDPTTLAFSGGPGQWRARVGGYSGSPAMAASAPVAVDVVAVVADGSTIRRSLTLTFARPVPCANTTQPGGSTTVPTIPATSTAAPTTTPATSPPTVAALGVDVRSPSPSNIDALIDGACPTRPTTFTVTADTQGAPDSVQARVTVPGVGTNTYTMANLGGGVWSVTLGPVNGSPSMPASGTISVEVRAERGGQTATDSTSLTVHRPSPCS